MSRTVKVDYTNHRGERRIRELQFTGQMMFGSTEWHPEQQWLLGAVDVQEGIVKFFALTGFNAFGDAVTTETSVDTEELEHISDLMDQFNIPKENDKGPMSPVERIMQAIANGIKTGQMEKLQKA